MTLRFFGSNTNSLLPGCSKASTAFTSFQPGSDPANSRLLALKSLQQAVAEVAAQTVASPGKTTLRDWLKTPYDSKAASLPFTSTTITAEFTAMVDTKR